MKTLKLSWQLLKYKAWLYIANIVIWSIVELIPLLPVLIMKEILDGFTENTSLDQRFWWLVGLTVIFYLVRIIFTYGGAIVGILHGFVIDGLLSNNLLKSIFKRPGAEVLNISPSEALDRFRDDVSQVTEMITWPVDVFVKFLGTFIAVTILAKTNGRITLMVILPLMIVLSILQQAKKKVHKYREASREATSQVVGAMGEIFTSAQAIQVAGAEEHVIKHFQRLNTNRHKTTLKDTLFIKIIESILNNVVHLGTGLILLLSAQSMRTGGFSVGDFALFINYWFLVADFTGNLGGFLSAYHHGKVSLERLVALLQDAPADDLVKHDEINIFGKQKEAKMPLDMERVEVLESMEVKDLSYRFPNNKVGIKGVNFTIEKGTFTVITGRIGAGKSTLVRSLLGLLPTNGGEVLWNGKKIDDPKSFFVPLNSAYTGQTPHLFSDTVRNNILLGRKDEDQEAIESAIYSAVLETDINTLEKGLDTVIGPRGIKLSGGQQQRLAAARMFANKSQLYVFDDISSALDVETEETLWSRLLETEDPTCIAISNRPTALQMAHQIIVMKDGEMIGKGTLEDLLESCREFQQIYGQNIQMA